MTIGEWVMRVLRRESSPIKRHIDCFYDLEEMENDLRLVKESFRKMQKTARINGEDSWMKLPRREYDG